MGGTGYGWYRVVLYRVVLYRVDLYRVVLYRVDLYRVDLYRVVLYRVVLYRTALYCTGLYCTGLTRTGLTRTCTGLTRTCTGLTGTTAWPHRLRLPQSVDQRPKRLSIPRSLRNFERLNRPSGPKVFPTYTRIGIFLSSPGEETCHIGNLSNCCVF